MLYKEETVEVYTRASDIMITNPLPSAGLPPQIRFNEERAVKQPDGELVSLGGFSGVCQLALTPDTASTSFDLLHPETNAVLGSATYQDLQVMLYSLYIHAADLRDNEAPHDPVPLPDGVNLLIDGEA